MRRLTPFLFLIVVLLVAGCGGGQHSAPHRRVFAVGPPIPAEGGTRAGRQIPPPPAYPRVHVPATRAQHQAPPAALYKPLAHVQPARSKPSAVKAPRVRGNPVFGRVRAHAKPRPAKSPKVRGDPVVGQILHSSTGNWLNCSATVPCTYTYQWQDCNASGASCVNIGGATGDTYAVVAGDIGHTIVVLVTASNSAGAGTPQPSDFTAVVTVGPPVNSVPPVITGTTTQGQTLTTTNGTWSGSPSFTRVWQDCDSTGNACTAISGATATTYTLAAGDAGHTIRTVVTASNSDGAASATSQPTAVIASTTGTVFYVDNAIGSNSNNGTSPTACGAGCGPWASISKVASTTLVHDQSVLFKGGETFVGELDGTGSGTSGHPTTYGSYGTGSATITNSGGTINYPTGISWVTFQNLIYDGLGTSYDCIGDFSGAAASHVTWDHVEVRNCTYGFDMARAADNFLTIQNSYIHNTKESGIVIGGPSHTFGAANSIIQGNQIEHTGTDDPLAVGSDAHAIYDNAYGLQVLNNDIGDYQTTGVSVRFGGALIQGNTIHNSHRSSGGDACVAYWSEDLASAPGAYTSTVRYNRCWGTSIGVNLAGANQYGGNPGPDNYVINNNTFDAAGGGTHGSPTNGIAVQSTMGDTLIAIQNNVFKGWAGGAIAKNYTPATWTENHNDAYTSGASPGGTGDITTNPNLSVSPAFAPPLGSPVIDAGTTTVSGTPTFTNSCNGVALDYCGSAPDIGAVEYETVGGTLPVNTVPPPAPNGTAQAGQSVSVQQGTWTGTAPITYAYQWQTCDVVMACTNITGETSATYVGIDDQQINHTLRALVTATNPNGSATVPSATTTIVTASSTTPTVLMGNFGLGATTSTVLDTNVNRATKYVAGASGTVNRMSIYLLPGAATGTENVQLSIYASSAGAPGALIATSTALAYASQSPAGWYDATLTAPLSVTAGTTYWISMLTGGLANAAGFRWDTGASGVRALQTNTFTNGPVNPFGTPTSTDNLSASFYAIIDNGTTPPPPTSFEATCATVGTLWCADFSTGDTSQWTEVLGQPSARFTFPSSPSLVSPGLRVEMRSGDFWTDGTTRMQLRQADSTWTEGASIYYHVGLYIDPSIKIDASFSNPWRLIFSWPTSESGGCSNGGFALMDIPGTHTPSLQMVGHNCNAGAGDTRYWTLANPTLGGWYQFIVHRLYSVSATTGYEEFWLEKPGETSYTKQTMADGSQIVHFATIGPTLPSGATCTSITCHANMRLGDYRNDLFTTTDVLYYDEVRAASTFAAAQ